MDKEEFYRQLVHRYITNQATEEELEIFFHLVENGEIDPVLESFLAEEVAEMAEEETQHVAKQRRLWPRIAVAASVLLLLSVSVYFIFHQHPVKQIAQNQVHDIAPGNNKAILTTRGRTIVLDSAKNGIIANQGNVVINKKSDGQVSYDGATRTKGAAMIYDTLTIPRGGQHQLVLADGTKAWLNADTKIRYPENFSSKERVVELISGEAYFEVAHNAQMPFKVIVHHQIIEDIGTHFNINAYDDEPDMRTTLLEGAVRVTLNASKASVVLKPGQQSIIQPINNSISIKEANTEAVTAWKDGYFRFDNADMATIMRQFSRWYAVEVVYQGQPREHEFVGKISRNSSLQKVLNILALGGVHYKIEAKKLIILP